MDKQEEGLHCMFSASKWAFFSILKNFEFILKCVNANKFQILLKLHVVTHILLFRWPANHSFTP